MAKNKEKIDRKYYYSMIEFEKDFFPEFFKLKYEKKHQKADIVGADLARDSFKKATLIVGKK